MSPSKNIWIATLGLGSLWAWSYALFPSAGLTTPFAETSAVLNLPDWFMSLVVGTAVYLVVAFCGRPALFERGGALLALLGTAAQTVCAVCMLMPAHPGVLDAASGAAFGAAAGLLWPCWFDVLGAMETEDSERVFCFRPGNDHPAVRSHERSARPCAHDPAVRSRFRAAGRVLDSCPAKGSDES